ncbi:PIN domain-containing protein [Leptolyngbya cf. ectocarpi LEGE 11479]|uniref:PIN domain-containing protein n=1 Tax=Leptolyngbya cf. ectocarpi LEGE 11479 TaxID=1828722 RepID=A0A928ZXX8_LEPEC|nr:PIN domain-containing protein [Leptolyngbya ectocarpi]MBE9069481.1 PIN domain-containing protein [Leptolyngbya cf. ectocarpi LEGE 11479]
MVKKVLFDTSTLVAALLEEHQLYDVCFPWLKKALTNEFTGYISTHTLAELYSVLTRLPRQPKLQPYEVEALLANLNDIHKVFLDVNDYAQVIKRLVSLKITGGGIYDALIGQAALKVNADILLTANPKDFVRLGDDVANIIRVLSVT